MYTYLGYPVYLWLVSRLYPQKIHKQLLEQVPAVSVVVAAKNEEANITARLQNLCDQDYPLEQMQLIVVSDGSNDRTVELLKDFRTQLAGKALSPEIVIIELPESKGKPNALNTAVQKAQGEILVFTDCRQKFATNALRELVANFSDPTIGCVSGELLFYQQTDPTLEVEMGAYWKYEKAVRKLESATGSVMGATGAIYAIRKNLYNEIPASTLIDDVLIPLQVVGHGKRVIFDSGAVAYDVVSQNIFQEWHRKVRTLTGNWQLLSLKPGLLNPWHNPFAARFFWHKVARLLVPFALLGALIFSMLLDGLVYNFIFFIQVLFYGIAGLVCFIPAFRDNAVLKITYFFCVLNLAVMYALYIWLSGGSKTIWKNKK
ncbi:glycosyltransferase family 2 protein [Desulfogranum japonicum]|uniref:glycosyltransferase family 2 protein n=1 Tax=Desulfogranum japonicum TaxID=231447 RepID=UPI00041E1285|nr:glycosyltransferase family 2 protein [Desulfogranum japonicum]